MAHRIIVGPAFVEVLHTGPVRYEDRLIALEALQATRGVNAHLPVLIDFSNASLVLHNDDLHASEEERVNYMARTINSQFFVGRRVAMVGISNDDAKPARVTSIVQQIPFQVFDDRDRAIAWLASSHAVR